MGVKEYQIMGIMTGTSADAADFAWIKVHVDNQDVHLLDKDFLTIDFPKAYREKIDWIRQENLLYEGLELGSYLSNVIIDGVEKMLTKKNLLPKDILAIGAHGQTLLHKPQGRTFISGKHPLSFQTLDPQKVAQRTGITVVSDFRRADIAMGGQGAPMAPDGHAVVFGEEGKSNLVINLGGIANFTFLKGKDVDIAFDCGPANVWLDHCVRTRTEHKAFMDIDGRSAKLGKADFQLLEWLLSDPYFSQTPPKSTDTIEMVEVYKKYEKHLEPLSSEDALATLTEATAESIYRAVDTFLDSDPDQILLCGGGTLNQTLVKAISRRFQDIPCKSSDAYKLSPMDVESALFAIFALKTCLGLPSNIPKATGATRRVLCGQISVGSDPAHIQRFCQNS